MPVGDHSTLGILQMPASDWPSHKHHKRPRRCKVPTSSFRKDKSRQPGFLGSILRAAKNDVEYMDQMKVRTLIEQDL